MKTTNYNIRLDPDIKRQAENTFAAFGLNLSEAINVFLHKAIMEKGFPFELRDPKPNAKLLQAMEETEQIAKEYYSGKRKPGQAASAHDMLAEILEEGNESVYN